MKNKTLLAAVVTLSLFCILCVSPPQQPTPQTTTTLAATTPTTTLAATTPTTTLAATTPTTTIETGLSDIQVEACNAADEAGTCHTKLPELGVISPEKCCEYLKKCCVELTLI